MFLLRSAQSSLIPDLINTQIKVLGTDPTDLNRLRLLLPHCLATTPGINFAFLLTGGQATGKSTLEALIRSLVGEENVISLRLADSHKDVGRTVLACAQVLLVNEVSSMEVGSRPCELLSEGI